MKPFILFAFVLSLLTGNAQTPLISHKSHAGSSTSYLIVSNSNFGLRRPDFDKRINPHTIKFEETRKVDNFKPLNDSVMILEVSDWDQNILEVDTLPNKKRLSTNMFHYHYLDSVKKTKDLEGYRIEKRKELEKQLESPQQIKKETTPVKKKKKSYLLFLFGITGGGMLLMKLFGGSKTAKPSIA